jgi:hypothetical protein
MKEGVHSQSTIIQENFCRNLVDLAYSGGSFSHILTVVLDKRGYLGGRIPSTRRSLSGAKYLFPITCCNGIPVTLGKVLTSAFLVTTVLSNGGRHVS